MAGERRTAEEAWIRSVLDEFEGRLTRYALRLTGNVEAARDVVQETFLRLCRQRRSEIEDHLAEWLYRVCRNQALDVRRKESHLDQFVRQDAEELSASEPSPALLFENRDNASRLLDALGVLAEHEQEVLRLKFQDGLKYYEIANITGRTTSHVGVLIHTAIKKLRAQLQADVAATNSE